MHCITAPVPSYFRLVRGLQNLLRRRLHEFSVASHETAWENVASNKLIVIRQLVQTLTQSYMQGIHIAQTQKKQCIPVLSIIPSAQVVRKELDSFKEFCAKYQRGCNVKELGLKILLSENGEAKKYIGCYRVVLQKLVRNYEKSRAWISLSSWHSYCLFSMLNYMSDQLQNQRYLQVDLQMKLMDTLTAHGISAQYSNFALSVIRSGEYIPKKRLKKIYAALSVVNARANQRNRAEKAKEFLRKWWMNACQNEQLVGRLDKRLQLGKLVQKMKSRIAAKLAAGFQEITADSDARKTKVDFQTTILKV